MGQPKDNRLSCEEIEELVPDLLYGELDAEREAQVRAQLPECELSDKVAGYERLRTMLRALPDEEPPAAISAQLMHAAAQHAKGRERAGDRPGWWQRLRDWLGPIGMHPGLAAAASVVLVAGVAGMLYMRGGDRVAGPKAPTRAEAPAGETIARPTSPPAAAATPVPAEEAADEGIVGGVADDLTGAQDLESELDEATAAPTGTKSGSVRGLESAKKAPAKPKPAVDKRARGKLDADSGGSGLLGGLGDGEGGKATRDDVYRGPVDETDDSRREAEKKRAEPVAEPEPEPADAPAAEAPPPPPKAKKSKNKRASSGELKKLHAQAVEAARAGDCARVRSIGARIERLDGAYYNDVFRKDGSIRACDGVSK